MQVYGDTSLDAPNRPQTHFQILALTLIPTLDARCGYALKRLSQFLGSCHSVATLQMQKSTNILWTIKICSHIRGFHDTEDILQICQI